MKQNILFACILFTAGLVACGKNGDSAIPDTSSDINVIIAVPGAQFDVAVDDTFIGTDLGEGAITGYKSFRAQRYNVYVYPAGDHSAWVAAGQLNLPNGGHNTVFLSLDHNRNLRLIAREDDLRATDAGSGKIRIVNLSDSYDTGGNAFNLDFSIGDLKDTVNFKGVNYLTATDFINIGAGTLYSRDVRIAGTTRSVLGKVPSSVVIVDGKITSWIVYNNALVADSFKLIEFVHN